jgi:hypothetical protein
MSSTNSRRGFAIFLPLALALPTVSACGGSGSGGSGAVGNVVIEDANNYTAMSTLTIQTLQTAPMVDLTFTWDALAKDLLCHTAGTIDNVAFLQIKGMSQDDIAKKLAVGKLNSNQVACYAEQHTMGATSVMMSTFDNYDKGSFTLVTDYVPSTAAVPPQYLALFTHGTALGVGAQSMIFLQPTDGVATTTVAAPNPCPDGTANGANEILNFAPTLSPTAATIPTAGPWKIDWSQITKDSFGNALDFSMTTLDKVEVGYFQGKTPAQIQADFLNVEQDATQLYTYSVPVGQKYVDLAVGGTPAFPGFGATAATDTWAVAVLCSKCQVPAPVVFTILTPQ